MNDLAAPGDTSEPGVDEAYATKMRRRKAIQDERIAGNGDRSRTRDRAYGSRQGKDDGGTRYGAA